VGSVLADLVPAAIVIAIGPIQIIAIMLLPLALRSWRSRPGPDAPAKLPGWLASIETVAPSRALGIGLLLSGPNLKIVLLTFAAGSSATTP